VVPKQTHQVEETVGVQVQDGSPTRLLPTGATLRVAVRAALLLPGGSPKRRLRVAAVAASVRVANVVGGGGGSSERARILRGARTGRDQSGTTSEIIITICLLLSARIYIV